MSTPALHLYGGHIVKKTEPKTQLPPFTYSNGFMPYAEVKYISSFYVFVYRELVRQMRDEEYTDWSTFKRHIMANYEERNDPARLAVGCADPAPIMSFRFDGFNALISERRDADEYEMIELDHGDHYYVCRVALAVVHGKY